MNKKKILGYTLMAWPLVLVIALNIYALIQTEGVANTLKGTVAAGVTLSVVMFSVFKGAMLTTNTN